MKRALILTLGLALLAPMQTSGASHNGNNYEHGSQSRGIDVFQVKHRFRNGPSTCRT